MTTISKTSYTISHFTEIFNARSKHLGKQLLKYLATEPHYIKKIVGTPKAKLCMENEKDMDSEKHIPQRAKIKFETRRHWQPIKWR